MKEPKFKVSIITLGCKTNQYESDSIAFALQNKGFATVSGLAKADAFVVNTCAITNEGERKSRGQLSKIAKINPSAPIFLCGCATQLSKESFEGKQNVVYVSGAHNKMWLAEKIEAHFMNNASDSNSNKKASSSAQLDQDKQASSSEQSDPNKQASSSEQSDPNKQASSSEQSNPNAYEDNMESLQSRTRATIKIQDGCNKFCSYCIVPFLRGRSRSRTIESIERELAKINSKEVVFTGIDLSSYGADLVPAKSILDVLELMRGRAQRFRISSLDVCSITDEFLQKLKSLSNFCPHFHLSVQSLSDDVLKGMNRRNTVEDLERAMKKIRENFENPGITADLIVGFPSETDKNFEETFANAKKFGFFEMHIFPFSPRKGTAASNLKRIDGRKVKERIKRMTELAKEMKTNFLQKQIGKTASVLIEKTKQGLATGHAENYCLVHVQNQTGLKPSELVSVTLKTLFQHGMLAEQNKKGEKQ